MYVVSDSGIVMIDSPFDTTQFQPLLDSIEARHHKEVLMCIATHSHDDRTAGLAYCKKLGIKTYTSRQTDEISKRRNERRAAILINKDTLFRVGQYSFQTFYPGPGHAPDNIVIWFGKQKVLYGGCFVKSLESVDVGNLKDANIAAWKKSILKVQRQFPQPDFIIPGHFAWTSNQALQHTLQLIKEHEKSGK